MTTVMELYEYRNSDNNCTIYLEKILMKDCRAPFWRVLYKYDDSSYCYALSSLLQNKPSKKRMEKYCESV